MACLRGVNTLELAHTVLTAGCYTNSGEGHLHNVISCINCPVGLLSVNISVFSVCLQDESGKQQLIYSVYIG